MAKKFNILNTLRSYSRMFHSDLLFFILFAFLFLQLVFFLSSVQAKVTGSCYKCHTIHNSQNGQPMAYDFDGTSFTKTATPKGSLLIYDCIGCHSATNGTSWQDSITKAPIVFNTVAPTYGANGLAGGNFYYVLSNDTYGHNVLGIKTQDTTLDNTPPGGSFPSGGTYTGQLKCAGTRGCHGHNGGQTGDTAIDDQTTAMRGAHHTDNSTINGSTVGNSYRFLNGIWGKEDTGWQYDNINTRHNEYKGTSTPPSFTDSATISFLCGECHGNFHSSTGVGSASPWLRHPTDAVLLNSGEYTAYTTYSMVAPVARPDLSNLPLSPDIVRPGTDIVMCLSCHRAHSSPYFKMVRWDYKGWPANGVTNGCNVCHTSKN